MGSVLPDLQGFYSRRTYIRRPWECSAREVPNGGGDNSEKADRASRGDGRAGADGGVRGHQLHERSLGLRQVAGGDGCYIVLKGVCDVRSLCLALRTDRAAG